MPSGRNTVTATSSGPNGRPPGAGSGGIRGRAPKARTSPSRWCSNPCSCPSANSSCYSGPTLARTIAGIGINVNQRAFDPALPNPVSMAVASGRTFDRRKVLESFHACCMGRYDQLVRGEKAALQEEYRKRMYRLGETHPYRRPDGTLVEVVLEGVRPSGELILRHADGTRHAYLFREIEFVIAGKS